MYTNIRVLLVYIYFFLAILISGKKNDSGFVAMRQWQVVEGGTPIPRGLHVRHNFQTGVTEAKLMDNGKTEDDKSSASTDNAQTKSLTLHPDKTLLQPNGDKPTQITSDNIPQRTKFSIEELKARLKNIKQNNVQSDSGTESRREKTGDRHKSYNDLKEMFESLSLNVSNDAELLTTFFQEFEIHRKSIIAGTLTATETKDVLGILSDLEYLIHQIDNAHLFTDMDGMATIIFPCINSTNNEIKAEALRLLGAAAQSNPKVQIKALESEFIQRLLHILSTNSKLEVKAKCLFALGALVRHFPAAQKALIDHGGLEIFGQILTDDQTPIQIKVLKLIGDLVTERQDLEKIDDLEQRRKKVKDYLTTRFEQKLVMHKYCQHANNLLVAQFIQLSSDQFDAEKYDFLEAISESAMILYPMCKDKYESDKNRLIHAISHTLSLCEDLLITADVDETDRLKGLQIILEQLKTTIVNVPHDEL